MDGTLRELTHMLLIACPNALPDPAVGTRIAFRLVFADARSATRPDAPGRFTSKELGSFVIGAPKQGEGELVGQEEGGKAKDSLIALLKDADGEPDKTLANGRFVIGDYVDCAILPPLSDGSIATVPPLPSANPRGPRDPGYPPPRGTLRENGYSGRGEFGGYGIRGGRGGGRFPDRGPSSMPSGEWRRGEAPPPNDYWGGGRGRGRGRGRGAW